MQQQHVSSIYIVGAANAVYCFGSGWFSLGAPIAAQNFPKQSHGRVLGLAKSYLGASSAFIAILKLDLCNNDTDFFMFALLWFTLGTGFIFGWFLRRPLPRHLAKHYLSPSDMGRDHCLNGKSRDRSNYSPHSDASTRSLGSISKMGSKIDRNIQRTASQSAVSLKDITLSVPTDANFTPWLVLAVLLALYLIANALIQDFFTFPAVIRYTFWGIAMVLWLTMWIWSLYLHGPTTVNDAMAERKFVSIQHRVSVESGQRDVEDIGMPQLFLHRETWLMYIAFVIVSGCGLLWINNIPQILQSAGNSNKV